MSFSLNSQQKEVEFKLPSSTALWANALRINLKLFSYCDPLAISSATSPGSGPLVYGSGSAVGDSALGLEKHCGMWPLKAPSFPRISEEKNDSAAKACHL